MTSSTLAGNSSDRSPSQTDGSNDFPSAITPELVREVTDKVYRMLLRDLRYERERMHRTPTASYRSHGGRL